MNKRCPFAIVVVVLLIVTGAVPLLAQSVTKSGTTAASFLQIPIGARTLAMGGANIAQAADATSAYMNPGVLDQLQRTELYFMHSEYFADIQLNYVGFVYPAPGLGTFAVSIVALNMDEMDITTIDDPEGLNSGQFDAGSFMLGLSFGRSLTDRFAIGATFKIIQENIWNSGASGFAVDVGTVFQTPFDGIRLGVSIANYGSKMQIRGGDLLVQHDVDPINAGNNTSTNAQLSTDRFDLPLYLRIGVAYDVLATQNSRLTIEVDGLHPNNNSESVNLGAELALLNERFFLRGGYQNLLLAENENSYTVGFGLQYGGAGSATFRLDYAYADLQHLQGIHQIGVSLAF